MRNTPVVALLLPEENRVLEAALRAYRKQTGGPLTRSDVVRHGVRQFCQAMGQAWPGETAPAEQAIGEPAGAAIDA